MWPLPYSDEEEGSTMMALLSSAVESLARPRPFVWGDFHLHPEDVWFREIDNGGRLAVRFFHAGYRDEHLSLSELATCAFMDRALGERLMDARLGPFSWHALPDAPQASGLRRLSELPEVLGTG